MRRCLYNVQVTKPYALTELEQSIFYTQTWEDMIKGPFTDTCKVKGFFDLSKGCPEKND